MHPLRVLTMAVRSPARPPAASAGADAAPFPLTRSYQALRPQLQEVLLPMLSPGRAIFLRRLKAKVTKAERRAQKRAAKQAAEEEDKAERRTAEARRRAAVRAPPRSPTAAEWRQASLSD